MSAVRASRRRNPSSPKRLRKLGRRWRQRRRKGLRLPSGLTQQFLAERYVPIGGTGFGGALLLGIG
jgi:hypothetical protein